MDYSTPQLWQEISVGEIIYTLGSLYDRFQQIKNPRKAMGKRYSLVTLLVLIFLAKLSGKDKPVEIADMAKNHAEELAQQLGLERSWMPHHNSYRLVFQEILNEEEFGRLLEEYHQQPTAKDGEVQAMGGKALRVTRTADQERSEYVLSIYNGQTRQVKAQEVVKTKENEIVAAPKVLARVKLTGKIVSGDAMDYRYSGSILSIVHNLALGLLKRSGFYNAAKGRRYFEGHFPDVFALLLAGNSLS